MASHKSQCAVPWESIAKYILGKENAYPAGSGTEICGEHYENISIGQNFVDRFTAEMEFKNGVELPVDYETGKKLRGIYPFTNLSFQVKDRTHTGQEYLRTMDELSGYIQQTFRMFAKVDGEELDSSQVAGLIMRYEYDGVITPTLIPRRPEDFDLLYSFAVDTLERLKSPEITWLYDRIRALRRRQNSIRKETEYKLSALETEIEKQENSLKIYMLHRCSRT